MAPPELAADRPVPQVFQPRLIGFGVAFGDKAKTAVQQRFQCQPSQRIDRHIRPLNQPAAEFLRQPLNRLFDRNIPLV